MINLITKTGLNRNPRDVIRIIKAVYGDSQNDLRIIHMLMMVARKQLQSELRIFDIKEILWGRTDSTFLYIFNLLFEMQTCNKEYVRKLVCIIVHKLQKYVEKLASEDSSLGLSDIFDYAHDMDIESRFRRA